MSRSNDVSGTYTTTDLDRIMSDKHNQEDRYYDTVPNHKSVNLPGVERFYTHEFSGKKTAGIGSGEDGDPLANGALHQTSVTSTFLTGDQHLEKRGQALDQVAKSFKYPIPIDFDPKFGGLWGQGEQDYETHPEVGKRQQDRPELGNPELFDRIRAVTNAQRKKADIQYEDLRGGRAQHRFSHDWKQGQQFGALQHTRNDDLHIIHSREPVKFGGILTGVQEPAQRLAVPFQGLRRKTPISAFVPGDNLIHARGSIMNSRPWRGRETRVDDDARIEGLLQMRDI